MSNAATKRGLLALTRIRRYLIAYSGIALLLSLVCVILTLSALDGWWHDALLAIGAYGVLVAFTMARAWEKLRHKAHDATRWTRFAMFSALPGSAVVALIGAYLTPVGLILLMYPSEAARGAVFFGLGAALLVGSVANLVVLLRLGLFKDLDELLWADQSERIADDDFVNFIEEPVLDFADAEAVSGVAEPAQER
jgi:uncharacterized membrane protein